MSTVASLRQIRRRIRSVENTMKITRAMEMVAAAKLRRFQDFLESARPHTERMEGLLNGLLTDLPPDYHHPYLAGVLQAGTLQRDRRPVLLRQQDACLILFTSDTGLCGTYNSDLENTAQQMIQNSSANLSLIFVGKHGANSLHKRERRVLATMSDLRVSRIDEILEELRKTLENFLLGAPGCEVHAVYCRMESLARYHSTSEKILPLPRKERDEAETSQTLIEPDKKTVFDRLIPAYFEAKLRMIFYHALLTEQIARMSTMRQATQNAKEMIDELTLLRNKARQASITKELIEVVSGSRALKLK